MFVEWIASRQADGARRRVRPRRGPRRDHAGGGFVVAGAAMLIGVVGRRASATPRCSLKIECGYDDSLDAFGVHGVGGTVGALATGVFAATPDINRRAKDGLIHGNPASSGCTVLGVARDLGLRGRRQRGDPASALADRGAAGESTNEEEAGLDLTQHG